MDRDSYCTPAWITDRLPLVDLDPCSNPHSSVKSYAKASIEAGINGLLICWTGKSIYCNPPYSDVMPWVQKAIQEARAFCFLVNCDPSTRWWRRLTMFPSHVFLFFERIQFVPPPGVDSSSNDSPQALVCDREFYPSIRESFKGYGDWWKNY